MVTIKMDSRQLQRSMRELAEDSGRADGDIIILGARILVRSLVFNTRLSPRIAQKSDGRRVRIGERGRARAGWWNGWKALGMPGAPFGVLSGRVDDSEGEHKDRTSQRINPSFEITNKVPYIGTLEAQDQILSKAESFSADKMSKIAERAYEKLLRKKSGGR